MAKKMEEAEVKKECPSCGLGVALDATVCEFCGWDFEEEDEWILQIEKLERDLMLEKQKFEPGTVEHKIESTLHTPLAERIDMIRARQDLAAAERTTQTQASSPASSSPPPAPSPQRSEPKGIREARPAEIEPGRPSWTSSPSSELRKAVQAPAATEKPEPTLAAQPQPSPKVRRIRTLKAAGVSESRDEPSGQARGKLVRKVKQ